jgi:hypothetical protein
MGNLGLLGFGALGIIGWIIGLLLGVLVFFIIRELWFAGIKKEIVDLYNKQIDFENKLSKIDNSLRMLVRMEKCRMIEDGYIDGETNRFKNWNIDKDFKPSKVVPITEQKSENISNVSFSENVEENISDKDIPVMENNTKKESKNIFQKIFGIFNKRK